MSKQEMTDLSFQLLVEFSFSALRTLIDAAGPERAIALNRPYWHHAGNAAGIILKNSMGWKEGDPNAIGDMYKFICYVNRTTYEHIEIIGTDWRETHIHYCPFETAPPEFCYLLDNIVANGMIEVIDPSQEAVFDQTKTQGAPHCIMRIFRKGTSPKRPIGQERIIVPPPMTGMSREEADSWAVQYIAEHWVMLTRAMMDFEGSEAALRTQLMSMERLGMSLGLRLQEQGLSRSQGAERIASLLDFSNRLFHQEGEVKLVNQDSAEREIVACPFQSAPPALCLQHEAFLNGVCGSVDPGFGVSYDQMMTKGDSSCRWVLERKALEATPPGTEDAKKSSAKEPLKVLAMRLAKGEISEEEFDRKRRLLKGT